MAKKIYFSIALVSFALIAFQIILMQIFSYTQWHHFAFMIISSALLGFGASGTVLSLYREWFIERINFVLPLTILLSGLLIFLSVPLSQTDIFRFDTYLVFADNSHIAKLIFTYLLLFLPFFAGALAIGLTFITYPERIGKLYFANMLGSGLGGVVVLLMMFLYGPGEIPFIISFFPFIGGLILINNLNSRRLIPVVIIFPALIFYFIFNPVELRPSQYKSISKTLNLPGAGIIIEKNHPYGLIQVVKSDALRYAPGISLNFYGNVPVRKAVFNNGSWAGPVIPATKQESNFVLNYTTGALVYKLTDPDDVLILNSGTGEDIVHALNRNAENVTAVEPNSEFNFLLFNQLAEETDSIYYRKGVKVVELYPRTFLLSGTNRYDIIKLPAVGVFGGTAGTGAVREEYLYTVESFSLIRDRLKPGGYFTVTSWMDYPYRNPLRLLSVITGVLKKNGIQNFEDHIIAVRGWGTITFFVKKGIINGNDITVTENFCEEMNFDPVILQGIDPEDRTGYNKLQDEKFFNYIDNLLSPDKEKFISDYAFRINAPTDNKPYFSQFLRWNNISGIEEFFGSRSLPFFELGYLIVILTLVLILTLSVILIILPLFKLGWKGKGKLWTVFYFAGLGTGYMFIEIVLIQKFILYFGHPVLSVTAVISFMLICSGAGSYFSSFIPAERNKLLLFTGGVVLLLILYIPGLDTLLNVSLRYPLINKIFLSILIIGLPAFLMGFPFPLGIKQLDNNNKSLIPWAWGINGCFSVISTVLAAVISVELGFIAVFIFAAGAYGTAFAINFRLRI